MVLEGGAFRGVYTSGVLDYLMQNGINMRSTVGVSAGAMTGVNYVSGQIGRSARVNLRFRHDSDYIGIGAIKKNDGIVGFDFLYNELDKIEPLDKERFADPERQFVAVATNCLTGEVEYFDKANCSDIYQAVRASASLPFVSKMVEIDGKPYLDGGCACKIPYKWAIEQGHEKIIVIKTRESTYRKPTPKSQVEKVCDVTYRNYPEFAKVLAKSDEYYNRECDELDELQKSGRVFVISPSDPVTVSRMESDMEKLGELYFLGYEDAKRNFEALKEYLAK
ncbi:MAG: patatin family protein [Clostridia bacterium]|nr:patatin family protein [Clostridia bacterium]